MNDANRANRALQVVIMRECPADFSYYVMDDDVSAGVMQVLREREAGALEKKSKRDRYSATAMSAFAFTRQSTRVRAHTTRSARTGPCT